jgi:hypothetical protein
MRTGSGMSVLPGLFTYAQVFRPEQAYAVSVAADARSDWLKSVLQTLALAGWPAMLRAHCAGSGCDPLALSVGNDVAFERLEHVIALAAQPAQQSPSDPLHIDLRAGNPPERWGSRRKPPAGQATESRQIASQLTRDTVAARNSDFSRCKLAVDASGKAPPHRIKGSWGRLYLQLALRADGSVSRADALDLTELFDSSVVDCALDVARTLRFPSPEADRDESIVVLRFE